MVNYKGGEKERFMAAFPFSMWSTAWREVKKHISQPEIKQAMDNGNFVKAYASRYLSNPAGRIFTALSVVNGLDIFQPTENGKSLIQYSDYFLANCPFSFIEIPEGVEHISGSCFYLSLLEDIKLPSTLKSIGRGAFADCHHLKKIIIPNGVTAIYNDAFEGCQNLEEIEIPDSVETLGENIFMNSYSVKVKTTNKKVIKYCKTNGIELLN